ncbi:MAG TPA: hypothetical protein DCS93_01355 [Microscillaceae bacterium]|nr:hypothetical protein [Microscillaceae bacterium]
MADTLLQDISQATTQSNTENFKQSEQRLLKFIDELNQKGEEIRIWIPDTSNFGHQSTSVHIMYRLATMGVQKIRIIYVVGEHDENWEKLYILILGLPPTPINKYLLNDKTTLYFSKFESENEFNKVMPLGITGGWDDNRPEGPGYFRVKDFCCLQPFLWEGVPQYKISATNVIYTAPNQPKKNPKEWIYETEEFPETYHMVQRGYYFSQPTLTEGDLEEFIRREGKSHKVGLIINIKAWVESGRALLVPVYFSPERAVAEFHDLFFNLFLGINYFQKKQPSPLPVIVLVMSEPQLRGYEALEATFNGSEVYNLSIPKETRINADLKKDSQRYQYLKNMGYLDFLQNKVKLFKDEEVSAAELRDAVAKYSLVQVSAIGLPKVVFDYMYGLSNLTMIFEGAGTGNLVMNLGKPFIRIRGADDENTQTYLNMYRTDLAPTVNTPFGRYGERLAITMETDAYKWETLMNSSPEKLPDEFIGNFLINGNRPNTDLHHAFLQQQQFYHSIYEDKLLVALHYWLSIRSQEEEQ